MVRIRPAVVVHFFAVELAGTAAALALVDVGNYLAVHFVVVHSLACFASLVIDRCERNQALHRLTQV